MKRWFGLVWFGFYLTIIISELGIANTIFRKKITE